MNRAEKLKSYCCTGLFYSVEEAEGNDEIRTRFTKFNGEFAWFIEVPDKVVGAGNLISNCPWCGTKLPKSPYLALTE